MSRYIDADAVIKKKWQAESEACFYALEDVVSVTDIEEATSIDIVRCKECKFNYANEHNCEYNPEDIVCTYWASDGLKVDDFCSYGEREGE